MGADAETKKNMKTLTRTDFLIQFLWKPTPAEELPEDPEQRKAKVEEQAAKAKEVLDQMRQAESQKNSSAVTIPSAEEIEKASKQKTSELEVAIKKALTTIATPAPDVAAGAAVAPGGAAPGVPAPGVPTPPGAAKPPH